MKVWLTSRRRSESFERWTRYEGRLVAGIVIGLVVLALLERLVIAYFRH
jgi:hypothetical protein